MKKNLIPVLALSLALTACSKDNKKKPEVVPENPDTVTFNYDLPVNHLCYTDSHPTTKLIIDFMNETNQKKWFSHNALYLLTAKEHHYREEERLLAKKLQGQKVRESLIPLNEVYIALQTLAQEVQNVDYLSSKTVYQKVMSNISPSSTINVYHKYNKENSNLASYIQYNEYQCYSGTVMNTVLQRLNHTGKSYKEAQFVVLLSKGHIRPGQIRDGRLYAIETTKQGNSVEELGEVTKINPKKMGFRVLSGHKFAVYDAVLRCLPNPAYSFSNKFAANTSILDLDINNISDPLFSQMLDDSESEYGFSDFDSPTISSSPTAAIDEEIIKSLVLESIMKDPKEKNLVGNRKSLKFESITFDSKDGVYLVKVINENMSMISETPGIVEAPVYHYEVEFVEVGPPHVRLNWKEYEVIKDKKNEIEEVENENINREWGD